MIFTVRFWAITTLKFCVGREMEEEIVFKGSCLESINTALLRLDMGSQRTIPLSKAYRTPHKLQKLRIHIKFYCHDNYYKMFT